MLRLNCDRFFENLLKLGCSATPFSHNLNGNSFLGRLLACTSYGTALQLWDTSCLNEDGDAADGEEAVDKEAPAGKVRAMQDLPHCD